MAMNYKFFAEVEPRKEWLLPVQHSINNQPALLYGIQTIGKLPKYYPSITTLFLEYNFLLTINSSPLYQKIEN